MKCRRWKGFGALPVTLVELQRSCDNFTFVVVTSLNDGLLTTVTEGALFLDLIHHMVRMVSMNDHIIGKMQNHAAWCPNMEMGDGDMHIKLLQYLSSTKLITATEEQSDGDIKTVSRAASL
jgi:hypothetical protein